MRVIKCRGFYDGKMYYPKTEHQMKNYIYADGYGNLTIRKAQDICWLEFTGLKDKNGKEIYEGDIIVFNTNKEVPYEIVFSKGSFKTASIKYPNENLQLLEYLNRWSEVIGNIYENPELVSK